MKSYNYTLVESYKQKIYIPILRIEIVGWLPLISGLFGVGAITMIFGTLLQFIIGSNAYFYAFLIAIAVLFIFIGYNNEKNNETGRTKLKEFYYNHIKSYRSIYDKNGKKHYLHPKEKGVMWYVYK